MATDEQIQHWTDEAEAGYDVDEPKQCGRGRPGRGAEPMQVVAVRLTAAELASLDAAAAKTHVLDFAMGAPTFPAKKNARGLKPVATDSDWTAGNGPQVSGPGEALLMAVAGRPHAFGELRGEGLPTLRRRVE